MPFVPCPSCRRHVRAGDAACPFCSEALPASLQAVPAATQRLGRGALFAFAVSVAACGGTETPETTTDTGAVSDGTTDSVTDTGAAKDDGIDTSDTGGPVAAYGGPPDTGVKPDTATDTAPDGTATDSGGGTPLYGSPPPF